MRNTQNPHIVDVTGVVTYSTGPAPAPMVSPLNSNFGDEIAKVAAVMNQIHADRIVVQPFTSLAGLAEVLQPLIMDAAPYGSPNAGKA
jgi:CRISPR-associated protein Cst2